MKQYGTLAAAKVLLPAAKVRFEKCITKIGIIYVT
jgi:hypothetical protein